MAVFKSLTHLFVTSPQSRWRYRRSLGSSLLAYVLVGAFMSLGGVSFLLFQILERQLEHQIQAQVDTKVKYIETKLGQVEQAVHSLSATVKTLNRQQVQDAELYKAVVLDAFEQRPPLTTALGVGQTPFQLMRDRQGFWPYFLLDRSGMQQLGQRLSVPQAHIRYFDLTGDQYFQQSYYQNVIASRKSIWLEPYPWYGMLLTTYIQPIWNDAGEIIGVTGLDINLTDLSQSLKPPRQSRQSYLMLLSAQGKLLADSRSFKQQQTIIKYQEIPLLRQYWTMINQGEHGIFETEYSYVAYQRVQASDWIILLIVPHSEVVTPVLQVTLIGTLFAGIVLTSVILLFINRLNHRLQPILDRCRQLGNFELELESCHSTTATGLGCHSDELDILEQTVEYMAAKLTTTLATLEDRVIERTTELSQALHFLQQTQAQLIHSEKMSSLGQMVAGIAHEINNPNNFIHANLQYLDEYTQGLLNLVGIYGSAAPDQFYQRYSQFQTELEALDFDFVQADLPRLLASMRTGTERIRAIVRALRSFSRLDESALKSVKLPECLDSVLVMLASRCQATDHRPEITILKEYAASLPKVECYAGELNQVLFNVLSNAIDAIDARKPNHPLIAPTIRIKITQLQSDWVTIHLADNGIGMTDDVKSRIFDPFFTTKPVGKGTGLGLSISYQIVTEQHNGKIYCDSVLGEGTQLGIEIPLRQMGVA